VTEPQDTLHARELQSHVQHGGKPEPNVGGKRTSKEKMEITFFTFQTKITDHEYATTSFF